MILFPGAEHCQNLVPSNISVQLSLNYNILDLQKHFCVFTISSKCQQVSFSLPFGEPQESF